MFTQALILTFLFVWGTSATNASQEIRAATCSFEDVSSAVAQAKTDDKILIPAGSCDWQDSSLSITKRVTLEGSSLDNQPTVIRRTLITSAPLIEFHCLREPLAFRVQKIHFHGLFNPNQINATADRGLLSSHGCQDFLITDNIFTGFAGAGVDITDHTNTNPTNRGVIANNRFVENYFSSLGYGVAVTSGGKNHLDIPFGSQNYVFIEDNYFAKNRHAVTSNLDAAYVLRHNIIEDNYPNFAAVDTHGKTRIGDFGGTKQVEIYNNIIRQNESIDFFHDTPGNNNPGFAGIGLRGGSSVIFGNQISNYRNPIILLVEGVPVVGGVQDCSNLTPPIEDRQPSGVYLWSNTLRNDQNELVNSSIFGPQNLCDHMFREGLEYNFSEKPLYSPYPYPHPLRPVNDNSSILDFIPAIISGVKKN